MAKAGPCFLDGLLTLNCPAQSLVIMLRLRRSIQSTAPTQCRFLGISTTRREMESDEEPFAGFFQQIREAFDQADRARGGKPPEKDGSLAKAVKDSRSQANDPMALAARTKWRTAAHEVRKTQNPPASKYDTRERVVKEARPQALGARYEALDARSKTHAAAARVQRGAHTGKLEAEGRALGSDGKKVSGARTGLFAGAQRRIMPPELWRQGAREHAQAAKLDARALGSLSTPEDYSLYMEQAKARMKARNPTVTVDYLSPTNSRLLNLALAAHLPPYFRDQHAPPSVSPNMLAKGHHLIYFPPFLPAAELLPDGTDPAHSPGEPFVRRMWAGGSLEWGNSESPPRAGDEADSFVLDGRPAWCRETVGPPRLKTGRGVGDQKVLVEVKRMYFVSKDWRQLDEHGVSKVSDRLSQADDAELACLSPSDPLSRPLVETRTLVFVLKDYVGKKSDPDPDPDPDPDGSGSDVTSFPQANFDFCFEATPDARLLFQFSALSHNAHAIHLDSAYVRDHEGQRGLLVHGPLTAVLMLSAVRHHHRFRNSGLPLTQFNYTNLAPLYAGERLSVFTRKSLTSSGNLLEQQVCILGPDGRLAVRGRARF